MDQVILNIHGIGTPARALEPGEDAYWISETQFQQAVDLAVAAPQDVRFTFDDGNLSDLRIAAPILTRLNMPATFFVLAGRLDTPGSLGVDDLRRLQDMGHTIGSHGWSHVDWTTLDDAGRRRELIEARDAIATACGQAVTEAGIPFGRYNRAVLGGLRQANYTTVYSSDGGPARPGAWPVARSSLTGDMTRDDIADLIAGREPAKKRLRRALTSRLKKVL